MYEAAGKGDIAALIKAHVRGGEVNWKNPNEDGRTALHKCVISGTTNSIECAEFLLQNGAKLDIHDVEGKTPIDLALVRGSQLEMINYLNERMKSNVV